MSAASDALARGVSPAGWRFGGRLLMLLGLLVPLAGSACTRATLTPEERPAAARIAGVGMGFFEERVQAFVVPPDAWDLSREDSDHRHTHLAWISSTGNTAYGVIYIRLPIYGFANLLTHNSVLNQFLREMEREEGEARLIERRWDGRQRELWFQAEGGRYRLDAVLRVRGRSAWATYVGELREGAQVISELELASAAREATLVGRDAARAGQDP